VNDQPSSGAAAGRPWGWIVVTGILALAVIGLAIWGFSTKSDLDDEKEASAKQRQQLDKVISTNKGDIERARATHRRLSRSLKAEEADVTTLRREAEREQRELKQARENTAQAKTADERTEAALHEARVHTDAARTCAKGGLAALDDLLNAPTPKAGAKEARTKLAASEAACEAATD
jgi:septal ring factor EnvC (AmiA/AmiB activator)